MIKNILVVFALSLYSFLSGQPAIIATSTSPLPFENINLFTDRDLYLSGESIWFSASINLDYNQEALSKIIYIEIFNTDHKSIVRRKYKIEKGIANGVFDIPSEFLSGVYYLRAYTNYNKNFPVEMYFISAIQVVNPIKGVQSEIAYITSNESITDTTNKYIIELEQPKKGMQFVSVYKTDESIESNDNIVTLELLNNRQQLLSQAEFTVSIHKTQVSFSDSTFKQEGLYYYVLKNEQKRILKIQALMYKDTIRFKHQASHFNERLRKRNVVAINLDKFIPSNYSSVGITVAQKGSILSTMEKFMLFNQDPYLLINFLKTQFNPTELSIDDEITSIKILNQKLNSDEYKKLFYPVEVFELQTLPEIRDIGLSGIVVDKKTQKPVSSIPVYLSIFKEHPQIHISTSKDNGRFFFSLNNFENNQDVFLCPLLDSLDNLEIKINTDFDLRFPKLNKISLTIDSTDTKLLEQMIISKQTKKAFKISSRNRKLNLNNLPYSFDHPEITIVLDDYIETPTLEMVFRELVPSVRVKKRKNNFSLSVYDTERDLFYADPLILIDKIPIFNANKLLKIPPKLIKKIEVHKTPFILGDHTINGIIMINTFTDNFGGMNMPKSSTFLEYQTVSPTYLYKTQNYSSTEKINFRTGDFRTLLHWNPLIQNGQLNELHFYTSDQIGEFEAYIFGINENGEPFHFNLFNIEVCSK